MKYSRITKDIYFDLLPPFVTCSTLLGFITGLSANLNGNKNSLNKFDIFANAIGYTSLGIITGFLFPVSFPLLTGYVLFKK